MSLSTIFQLDILVISFTGGGYLEYLRLVSSKVKLALATISIRQELFLIPKLFQT